MSATMDTVTIASSREQSQECHVFNVRNVNLRVVIYPMAVFPSGASQDAFCKEAIVRLIRHNFLARIFVDGYGCGPVSQLPLADRLSGSALRGIVLDTRLW